MIAFFGSERERRMFVVSRHLDNRSVILARPGAFDGINQPLEIIYCSGSGLTTQDTADLHQRIQIINATHGKRKQ